MVRIRLPPAESLSLGRIHFRRSRTPAFRAVVRGCLGARAGRDAPRVSMLQRRRFRGRQPGGNGRRRLAKLRGDDEAQYRSDAHAGALRRRHKTTQQKEAGAELTSGSRFESAGLGSARPRLHDEQATREDGSDAQRTEQVGNFAKQNDTADNCNN
jgi:hypothetical protein